MKTILRMFGVAAVLMLALAGPIRAQNYAEDNEDMSAASPDAAQDASPPDPTADTPTGPTGNTITFQTFYDNLAPYGTWIKTDQYGYVFQPKESDPNWAPYTYGHWVNTDDGMTWASDEPFGWATYHYGRWVNLSGIGWAWVPGYTWAPAWVSWRQGATEVGWAPLPPDSDVGIDYYGNDDYYADYADGGYFYPYWGFHIGDDCDLAFGIGPWWYNFCPIAFIGDRDCWHHFHHRADNFGLIGHTRNVTNINFERNGASPFGHVHANGPNVAALNEQAHTRIPTASLTATTRASDAGLHGNTLSVFAPRVDPATGHTARPAAVSRTVAGTTVNRGTNINDPPAVNSRVAATQPTAAQIHAAAMASTNSAINARVATTQTQISRPLTRPLTEMHVGVQSRNVATHESVRSAPDTITTANGSRFTGAPVERQTTTPQRTFTPATSAPTFHSYSMGSFTRTEAIYPRTSTPAFHTSSPSFYRSAPSFYSRASNYHSFAPQYYSAPAAHYSYSAPAAHFYSGGGFHGGGGFSGGGGFHGGGGFSGGGGFGGGGGHR